MEQLDLIRLTLSLVLVVVFILVVAWFTRRSGLLRGRHQAATIQLVASQSLGARSHVAVVDIDEQRLVLGVTQQQITLLHTFPSSSPSFDAELHHAHQHLNEHSS